TRIEEADDGRAHFQRHVLDLDDLLRMRFRKGAAEDREILCEDEDRTTVDGAPAGDDAIAGDLRLFHAEIGRAMFDEHVELLEGMGVQQKLDPLAGGQLSATVLSGDPLLTSAQPRLRTPVL